MCGYEGEEIPMKALMLLKIKASVIWKPLFIFSVDHLLLFHFNTNCCVFTNFALYVFLYVDGE